MSNQIIHVDDMPDFLDAVYIGRAMPHHGLAASPFANPFKIGRDGDRLAVVTRYLEWLGTQPALIQQLPNLRGKPLACWCRHAGQLVGRSTLCHGDILIRLLDEADDETLRSTERIHISYGASRTHVFTQAAPQSIVQTAMEFPS